MTDSPANARRVFTGVKFAVDVVNITTHDGQAAQREMIAHPGAVIVLPLTDDGQVVMIRNERFAVGQTLWELCAGTLEEGEPPIECAKRELIEETGYQTANIEPLSRFYTSPGMSNELMHAFVARDLTHVGQQLEATEKIEVELLPLADVLEMVRDGRIMDGKTIAALLHYQLFVKQD
jgi:ADP-ribose pyrophosphatase